MAVIVAGASRGIGRAGGAQAGGARRRRRADRARRGTFDFDAGTGAISNRRRLVDIDEREGLADGLAVDAGWVALCFGEAVRRYMPGRRLDAPVRLQLWCSWGGTRSRSGRGQAAGVGRGLSKIERRPGRGAAGKCGVTGREFQVKRWETPH